MDAFPFLPLADTSQPDPLTHTHTPVESSQGVILGNQTEDTRLPFPKLNRTTQKFED